MNLELFAVVLFATGLATGQEKAAGPAAVIVKPAGSSIQLSVAHEFAMSKWYQEKLGFHLVKEEMVTPGQFAWTRFAVLETEGVQLRINEDHYRPGARPAPPPAPTGRSGVQPAPQRQNSSGAAQRRSDVGAGKVRKQTLPPGTPEHPPYGIEGAGVIVNDLDETYRRVKSRGAEVAYAISPTDDGYRSFAVRDPEGNLIVFFGK